MEEKVLVFGGENLKSAVVQIMEHLKGAVERRVPNVNLNVLKSLLNSSQKRKMVNYKVIENSILDKRFLYVSY